MAFDRDATLDRGNELPRGTFDLDVVGHYGRPDVFRLVVDRSPRSVVSWESTGTVAGQTAEATADRG